MHGAGQHVERKILVEVGFYVVRHAPGPRRGHAPCDRLGHESVAAQ